MDAATADELVRAAEAARAAVRRGDRADGLAAFERQYHAMREALDWFIGEGQPDSAFRLSAAMVPCWMGTERVDEGIAWLQNALASGAGSRAARSRAFHDHGYLSFFAGRYPEAERSFAQAADLAERAGDGDLVALALAGSARVALNDDPAESVRLLRRAMALTEDVPDSAARSSAEHVLGVALQLSGDLDGAAAVIGERLEHARAAGNTFTVFSESANLSTVERKRGNLERATSLARESVRIAADMGDVMAVGWTLNTLAAVTCAAGEYERAADLLALAESILRRAGGEWPADEREQHHETLARLEAALPAAAIEEARRRADARTVEDAVAEALSDELPAK